MDCILELPVILDYLREREYPALLGESLFPERKIQGLKLEYIKGSNNVPVMASVHAFDSESEIASRDAVAMVEEKIALIKRKIRMNEETIIALKNPRTTAERNYMIEKIYNDIDNMVMSVRTRIEAMRMEALATGKISFDENGIVTEVDYGVPDNHKEVLSGASAWSSPTSTPLDDIQEWSNTIVQDSGVTPTRALTSNKVIQNLLKHPSVGLAIFGSASQGRIVTLPMLNQLLTSMGLPQIVSYDSVVRVQKADGSYETKRYFPEDTFVMLPEGSLGETIYGLTAEEIRLQQKSDVETNMFGNILAMVYDTNDPVATWTKAVATSLPSFPMADSIFISTVLE